MKKCTFILYVLISNILISCSSISVSSEYEDSLAYKQSFYDIANKYCFNNDIPLLIENEKVIFSDNPSEEKIILFINLIDKYFEIYGKNLAYFNDLEFELEYINGHLVIHETELIKNYEIADYERQRQIYEEMHNFIGRIATDFYEQCIKKGLKYPIFIPRGDDTILIIEFIKINNYIMIDDNDYLIISTSNEDNNIINLIEYIFIYIDEIKEDIINNNFELFDDVLLFFHLNLINKYLIENLGINNRLAEYYQKIEENRMFIFSDK